MAPRKTPSKSVPPAKATQFDYDAVKTTGRRRAPASTIRAEHVVLPTSKRRKLLATVQDQIRNASTAAWAVRRHLDYVSKFKFQFRTGREGLDKAVNRLFDWHAAPRNFDVAARFGREEMFRMFEMEKVTAGDAAMIMLQGMYMQAIESDLIAYPNAGKWNVKLKRNEPLDDKMLQDVHKDTGVVMDPTRPGRVAQFCVCNRGADGRQLAFDHLEAAENVIFDAYWTRFSSQIRGVSPLSTAINAFQDLYEGIDFNLAKSKIHSLFGIAVMRDYYGSDTDQEEVSGWGGAAGIGTGNDENIDTASSESEAGTKAISATAQELKPNEMMFVDMDTKGRIDTIESKTPSNEFQNFTDLVLRIAFLALDIPFTAFNSAKSSFSGIIADQNLYDVSCRSKREKNKWVRQAYSNALIAWAWDHPEWQLQRIAEANEFRRLRELQEEVEWVAAGSPWLQKLQEVQGDIKAISVGADNPVDVCKRRGGDFFHNIDRIAEAYAYAKDKGVPLMIGEPGQASIEEIEEETQSEDEGDE